jgi:pimeloyl-ACP methyl ester carboxylesterase
MSALLERARASGPAIEQAQVTRPKAEPAPVEQHQVELGPITMQYASVGKGPAVLLCHGWPETWRSWRHQMTALATAGFRAIAPDMRGFGGTSAPIEVVDYTIFNHVGDMVALLDHLKIAEAVIVGHDWGASIAWHAALLRPDRFRAVVGMSVPWAPRGPVGHGALLRRPGLERFYMNYFQTQGRAEAELARDVARTMRLMMVGLSGDATRAWDGMVPHGGLLAAFEEPRVLPSWLEESELAHLTTVFARTGFRGGLNWYRNLDRNWALLAPFAGQPIRQPALFVAGSRDPVLGFPGLQRAVANLKAGVPNLRDDIRLAGGHWIQQERPREVNEALLGFLAGLPPKR